MEKEAKTVYSFLSNIVIVGRKKKKRRLLVDKDGNGLNLT